MKIPQTGRQFPLWFTLVLLLAASFAVRFAALSYWGTGTIESEGAEYAKIAENLRNGVGYVGLVSAGPQVLFNPLFPLLIYAFSFVSHDFESAGRIVAMIFGAMLPLPVFGIASRLFNRRVGFIAAILSLLHPLSVYLSFMVYSEGPYATLLLSSVCLVLWAMERVSIKVWLLVGASFGLCYLLRAEATAAFGISILFALLATPGNLTIRFKRVACAIAVFSVFALPELIFLYKSTGKVLLESKSTILFSYTGRRLLEAERNPDQPYDWSGGLREIPSPAPNVEGGYPGRWEGKWAFYGIDPQLNPTGTAMRPFAEIARATKIRPKDLLPLIKKGIRYNVPGFLQALSEGWLGAPLLPALALLGALRRPWRGRWAVNRLFVLCVAGAPVMATLFVLWGDARYYFIFIPILCIWAANGLYEAGRWMKTSISPVCPSSLVCPTVAQLAFTVLLGSAVVIIPVKRVRSLYEFSDSAPPTRFNKEVGLWIRHQQDRPIRIMDLSLPLSYHADAEQHVYFPYCDGALALRFLDSAQIDYIVLRRGEKFTEYYDDWLNRSIPDNRAEKLKLPQLDGAEKLVIYRWNRSAGTN